MLSIKDEFIGKKIKIISSTMKHQLGVEGLIVDESKNTFTILSEGREIKVFKSCNVFLIDGTKMFGAVLQKRPEERIKIKEK